jgi:hypothetical protein
MKPTIRSARPGDYEAFTGSPQPWTGRSVVMEHDGKILGMGSIVYQRGSLPGVRMEMTDEARRFPVSIHRAGKALMGIAERAGIPALVAVRDGNEKNSARWLSALGFEYRGESEAGEIWIWQRSSPT